MATNEKKKSQENASEGIGGLVDELASSWILGDALTRVVDVGEKAFRAQQTAFSALGLPSGSEFESLTLRVRTIFHRLEELEDEIDRLSARIAKLEAKPSAAAKSARRAKAK